MTQSPKSEAKSTVAWGVDAWWETVPDRFRVAASLFSDTLLIIVAAAVARILSESIDIVFPSSPPENRDATVSFLQGISSISTIGAFALYTIKDFIVASAMVWHECTRAIRKIKQENRNEK